MQYSTAQHRFNESRGKKLNKTYSYPISLPKSVTLRKEHEETKTDQSGEDQLVNNHSHGSSAAQMIELM